MKVVDANQSADAAGRNQRSRKTLNPPKPRTVHAAPAAGSTSGYAAKNGATTTCAARSATSSSTSDVAGRMNAPSKQGSWNVAKSAHDESCHQPPSKNIAPRDGTGAV